MPRDTLLSYLRSIALIAEKDMRIYYTKPPVLMFGFLFPLFMFLAFSLGRSADLHTLFPGLAAMFVFFVASSVGPLITPWEKRAGTYERLLSFPVTVNTLILGDVVAGMLYGIIINVIILAARNGGVRLLSEFHRSSHHCYKPGARRVLFLSSRRAPRVSGEHKPLQCYAALKPRPLSSDLHQRHICADCEPPRGCKSGGVLFADHVPR